MNAFSKYIFILLSLIVVGISNLHAQDTCNVQSYIRADGVLIRGVDFEPVFENDTLLVSAAMYTIDKGYFLVLRIEGDKKIYKYTNDLAIQFSDSTIILLPFDTKDDRNKKTYEIYFKINNNGLGYVEKYPVDSFIYTINDVRRSLIVQRGHILQRHFDCLRNN